MHAEAEQNKAKSGLMLTFIHVFMGFLVDTTVKKISLIDLCQKTLFITQYFTPMSLNFVVYQGFVTAHSFKGGQILNISGVYASSSSALISFQQ